MPAGSRPALRRRGGRMSQIPGRQGDLSAWPNADRAERGGGARRGRAGAELFARVLERQRRRDGLGAHIRLGARFQGNALDHAAWHEPRGKGRQQLGRMDLEVWQHHRRGARYRHLRRNERAWPRRASALSGDRKLRAERPASGRRDPAVGAILSRQLRDRRRRAGSHQRCPDRLGADRDMPKGSRCISRSRTRPAIQR